MALSRPPSSMRVTALPTAVHWLAMRARRCLAVLTAAASVSMLAAGQTHADVTPEAFGNCGKRAARSAIVSTDVPARVKAALPEGYVPELGTRLARFYFRPYFVECSDLNGDNRRELIAEFGGSTVSSPTPWTILEVPRGHSEPRVAFLQPEVSYLTLLVRRNYVVERQKTFLGNEPNCCPAGPPKVRFVRWTGTRFEYTSRRPPDEDVPDPPPEGGSGPPPPSGEPGCEGAVQAGPLELRASCFRRQEDGTYQATGQVRINGIDLVPARGDAEVVFDPESLELRASGTVQLQVGPVVLYEGTFNRNLGASFTLRVPGGSSLKGFPVTGEAKVTLRGNGAEIAANVSIEALGGVSGGATLTATTTEGLRLDALNLKVGQARVGPIPIRDVSLGYTRTAEGDRWEGGATIELPGPKLASLTGFAAFLNGGFVEGRGELAGSFPVFPGVLLTKVSAGLVLEPEFGFSGGMALSAGPSVLGVTAASVDGTFTYQDGAPALFRLNGDITLVKVKLAGGELAYRTNGQITMRGNLDLTLGGVGFQGDLAGFVDGLRAFSAEGSGTVGYKGAGLGGEGIVSSVGAAACGNLGLGVKAGFGVRWDDFPKPDIMELSCGIGDWRVAGPASARASQAAGRSFRVRRGTRQLTLSAVGEGAPPAVTLRGPGGVVLSAPASGATLEDGRLAFRNEADATSYLTVARPRPGRWTLAPEPGSARVVRYRRAHTLGPVRVRARVSGRGATRRLRWSVSRRRGLRVSFYERSGAGVRRIAVTRGGRGARRFRPAATSRPRRRIIALIERGGLPEDQRVVDRFRARSRRPGRPSRVRVRRRRGVAIVRFSRSRRAIRHEVRVRISDGRTLLFLPRRPRTIRVGGVARRDRVTVTVRGLDGAGRTGPARRARLRR
jgi:hypothetical protein